MSKSSLWVSASLMSIALAACGGGGGGGGDEAGAAGPSSSSASSSASQISSASSSSTSSSSGVNSSVSSSSANSSSSVSSSSLASSSSSSNSSSSASVFVPANGSTGAYVDTTLQITFDAAPTLGSTGYIYVYKASDNSLIDKISLNVFSTGSWADDATAATPGLTATALSAYNTTTLPVLAAANTEVDKIGNVSTLTQYRWVLYRPVTISGTTATIKLHDNKLQPSTAYYVTMDSGVLNGNINGSAYKGISSPSVWAFTTKADPSSTTNVVVDDDGEADYRTVQGALNWMMKNCGGTNATATCGTAAKTITIKNGTYNEMLFARNISNLTIQGESRDGAIVQYDMYNDFNPGTGGSASLATVTGTNLAAGRAQKAKDGLYRAYLGGGRPVFLVEGADLLNLTQFTLQNTHIKNTATNGQAEAIYFNSATLNGSRLIASYMNFLSQQDTIQVKGWSWFYRSLIRGDVDFIWGSPFSALFEESELRTSVDPTSPTSGGYLIESRTAYGYPGFVVLNSSLTREAGIPDGSTMLGRQANAFATSTYCNSKLTSGSFGSPNLGCNNVAYINTKMGPHIKPAGWLYTNTPPITTPTAVAGYRESGSMGPTGTALSVSGRDLTYASTSIDLSGMDTRNEVFAQWNSDAGWKPTAAICSTSACTTNK